MGAWLLGVVTVIYVAVAASYGLQGRWGMCMAFVAYGAANVGFILDILLYPNGR